MVKTLWYHIDACLLEFIIFPSLVFVTCGGLLEWVVFQTLSIVLCVPHWLGTMLCVYKPLSTISGNLKDNGIGVKVGLGLG